MDQEQLCQESVAQMMMPTWLGAGFIMIQARLPFAFFQGSLHGPAQPTDADEFAGRTRGRRIAEIELEFRLRTQSALHHEPETWTGQLIVDGRHPQKSKLSDQGPLLPSLI